jgi:hypothetical protein
MAFSVASWKAESTPRSGEVALAALGYGAMTILATWPLVLRLSTLLGAPIGEGDPYLNLWILGWDLRVLFDAPGALLSGRVFDAPIFHPARQTLAYSDHLLPQALLVSPVYAVTRDPVVSYNVLWMGSIWASALAMWWYLRQVTGHRAAALIAGAAWAFSAYRMSHVVHLQLQGLYFLPLAALAVHRLVAGRRRRDGAWLGLWFGLTALGSVYYAVIGGLGLAALLAGVVLGAGRHRLGQLVAPLAVAALVTGVLLLPVLGPYVQVQQREGFGRTLDEASRHAAGWRAYASEPPWRPVALAPVGLTEEEALRPGWGVLLLAALAMGSLRTRGRRPHVWGWLAVVGTGLVLSFGPEGVGAVYAWCHRWLFGFHAVRAPARFGVLVAFGTAALAAYGVSWALSRTGLIRALAVAGVVLVAGESLAWRVPAVAAPRLDTPVAVWLRDAPGPGAVVYLPMPPDRAATPAMLETLVHGRPLVNGYSGQRPSFYGAVEGALATFPSADALWMLHDLQVRFVVAPVAGLEASWPLQARAALADHAGAPVHIYEVADEEALRAALGEEPAVSPPPPGTPAFRAGERARYDVFWDGAGTAVAAGTVLLRVDAADPADDLLPAWLDADARARLVWRVAVEVETRPWMARIFEARDVFVTWADAGLLPVAHRRIIREGRRRVDQSVAFDAAGRSVTTLAPDETALDAGLRVRMPPEVRDPLTALLLLRAVDLGEGVRLPMTDMGRLLTLETGPITSETIEWRGTPTRTWRLQPVLAQRVHRRKPPAIDLWLGRDEHDRLPLRAEVEAGFGRVRLELVEATRAR